VADPFATEDQPNPNPNPDTPRNGWLIVHPKLGAECIVNVIPNFGREHICTADCWCCPRSEWTDDGRVILVHECDN
jgi:hypothetical protein